MIDRKLGNTDGVKAFEKANGPSVSGENNVTKIERLLFAGDRDHNTNIFPDDSRTLAQQLVQVAQDFVNRRLDDEGAALTLVYLEENGVVNPNLNDLVGAIAIRDPDALAAEMPLQSVDAD